MIYVLTPQHTGTWFLLNFLQRLGLNITQYQNIGEACVRKNYDVIHSHVGDYGLDSYKNDMPERIDLYRAAEIIRGDKVVFTVRDPLLSIISRHNRNPDLSHSHIINGFLIVASLYEHKNSFCFPIDIKDENRANKLYGLIDFLDMEAINPLIVDTSEEWKPVNITDDPIKLKESYENGDYDLIKRLLKEEISYIKATKDKLIPFLKNNGYENLPWYDW